MRERRLARYPLVLDAEGIQHELIVTNLDTVALHYPGRDGLCPLCREGPLCAPRLQAVQALREMGVRVPVLPPHEPRRPQWHCELCDEPWPCAQVRVVLGDRYEADRAGLARLMGVLMVLAARESVHARPDELYDRLLEWVLKPWLGSH